MNLFNGTVQGSAILIRVRSPKFQVMSRFW